MTEVTVPLGPAKVNITGIRAGDRNAMQMSLKSSGTPVDLSDLTVTAQARRKSTDADAAIIAEIEVLDATAGEIELRWPGDQVTAALAGRETWAGVWDLQLDSDGLDALTVVAGNFAAEMDVTR